MNISLNGKSKDIPEQSTLASLIKDFCSKPEHVVAELNDSIIQRQSWPETRLKNNDRIELVSFVGGG